MNLVISPHPDDAEYSMSGTIFKNKDQKYVVVTMSSGGDNDDTTSNIRLAESEKFWSKFPNVEHVGYNSKTIYDRPDWEIVGMLDQLVGGVDSLYIPPLDDNHFEHRKISECARAATRGKPIDIIEYYTPSTRSTWVANMFVDIEEYMYEKDYRLHECFPSQDGRFYFTEENIEIFHEDYFCRLRGLNKVEKFRVECKFS